MKVLITGSHFTPAWAVIEELKKHQGIEITYLGRKNTQEGDPSLSAESQVLPRLGIKFIPLICGRLQRSFTLYTIPSLLKIPLGFFQSFYCLLKEKPDVILSFGGYVSVPVVIAGWLLSTPIIIHEQTLISGLANTISSWFADKVAVSFPKEYNFCGKKVVLTGNPMRKELTQGNLQAGKDIDLLTAGAKRENLPLVFITGGSQGSHLINQVVSEIISDLVKVSCVVHQTGDSKLLDYEKLLEVREKLQYPERYLVAKWIDSRDLKAILQQAALVVSRGGINTLLELAYFQIPTLVIPIPYIYKNEQVVNAKFFEKAGLTHLLLQENLTAESLLGKIKQMLKNSRELKKRAENARGVVIPDASKRLTLETILLASKR